MSIYIRSVMAFAALCVTSAAFADAFMPIGYLAGAPQNSGVSAVSDNGIATGSSDVPGGYAAIRWSQATGIESLGDLSEGALNAQAYDISADGTVIVGRGSVAAGNESFRWTSSDGMQGLGYLGSDPQNTVYSVSADGSTIVGLSNSSSGSTQAVRWTQSEGFVPLGYLTGGTYSWAQAISADGSTVVGTSQSANASQESTRWDHGVISSMGQTSFLDDHYYYPDSNAVAVSDDGSVIVTQSEDGSWRWTAASGFVQLPGLQQGHFGHTMQAFDISGDGAIIVGAANANDNIAGYYERAAIWTATTGSVYLQDYLTARGVSGLPGWTLLGVEGISHNGRYLAGDGLNASGQREGFVVDLSLVPTNALLPGDANKDGLVDGADYTTWADHFLQTGQSWTSGDFNNDGRVDGADYVIWADHFAPVQLSLASVPEPSTLVLSAIGALALLAQRLRRRSL